jgi:7-cyano-7-deazaguanine synthase
MKVLLLSGGLDSATVLYGDTFDACLCVDYGQPHIEEIRRARHMAYARGVPLHEASVRWHPTPPTCGLLGGHDGTAEASVVPGRNAMFVALAATLGATTVVLGCNADDQEAYIDCRLSHLRAVAAACGVAVELPLAFTPKSQVVRIAGERGAPVKLCMTCYRGVVGGCGECAACKLLAAGFGCVSPRKDGVKPCA